MFKDRIVDHHFSGVNPYMAREKPFGILYLKVSSSNSPV